MQKRSTLHTFLVAIADGTTMDDALTEALQEHAAYVFATWPGACSVSFREEMTAAEVLDLIVRELPKKMLSGARVSVIALPLASGDAATIPETNDPLTIFRDSIPAEDLARLQRPTS